jgi:hypothetical protein
VSELAVDLLLGPGLLSRTIAWYGEGYGGYSHAASVIDAEWYIDSHADVIANVPPGVQIRAIATEKCIRRRRCALQVSDAEYERWVDVLHENLGDPYGDTDIWAFITGRKEHSRGHWICSANALRALRKINRIPALSVPDHQITPNSLLLILETAGFQSYDLAPIV